MIEHQPGTLIGTLIGGGTMLIAQLSQVAGSAIDPITQWLANLGGIGVLIWMVLRQDSVRKADRDLCDREIDYLKEQLQALWNRLDDKDGETHA